MFLQSKDKPIHGSREKRMNLIVLVNKRITILNINAGRKTWGSNIPQNDMISKRNDNIKIVKFKMIRRILTNIE